MYKTQPRCITSPVVTANMETQKYRQCNPCLYSQSSLLNTRRLPCHRSKNSDWSIKKRSTVVQSSTRWQNRPHWSELKPVYISYLSNRLLFKPHLKSTALRVHIHECYKSFKIGTNSDKVFTERADYQEFFFPKCTEVKMLVQ